MATMLLLLVKAAIGVWWSSMSETKVLSLLKSNLHCGKKIFSHDTPLLATGSLHFHYKSLFSEIETFENYIEYTDDLLPDMRGHNNILIKANGERS